MESRKRNIIISKAGGNAGSTSKNYKVSLPADWVASLGVTEEDREVNLVFNGKEIKIKMSRDIIFGKLLGIANVLSYRLYEGGRLHISERYMTEYSRKPAKFLKLIHGEIMEYVNKFGEVETNLINEFTELIAELSEEDFTNEPLNERYLHAYYTQQKELHDLY